MSRAEQCGVCPSPQGDSTCAACCLEGELHRASIDAARLRDFAAIKSSRELRDRLRAWAAALDEDVADHTAAIRELRADPEWEP